MRRDSQSKSSRGKFWKLLVRIWPTFAIIAVVLIFFYPVWVKNLIPLPADFVVGVYYPWLDYKWGFSVGVPVKNPMTTDVVSFVYPMQMLAIDLIKSGQWPLWNPYILTGTPLLANFQSAPFSPTNFVYFLFDRLTAWSVQVALQHFLAAIFTYLLLRYWKVSRLSSVLGGVIFAFSGFNTIWSQWNGHALSGAFIPLLILLEDRWLKIGKWRDGALFSVVLSAQILSGYPQVVFYTGVALVLLAIFRFEKTTRWLGRLGGLGIFGLLGIGLSSFQILPGAELLSLSQREIEPHPYGWAFLPWVKIITFLAPDYFGNHATQNYWGPQDYTSNTGFVGVVAFSLAVAGAMLLRKKREVIYIVLVLVFALLLSFPTPISVFLWESGLFGFQAASAHRALVLFNLSVALLAAFGADCFLETGKLRLRTLLPAFSILIVFSVISVYFYLNPPSVIDPTNNNLFGAERADYRVGLRNLVLPILAFFSSLLVFKVTGGVNRVRQLSLVLVFLIMLTELYWFWAKFTPFSPRRIVFPKTPVLEFLEKQEKPFRTTGYKVIPINMRMPYKIETLEGYDAIYPLSLSQFVAAITSGKSGTQPVGRYATIGDETVKALDLVNVKYVIAVKRDERSRPSPEGKIASSLENPKLQLAYEDKSVVVLESRNVLPRAFVVYSWERSLGNKTLDRFLDPDFPISEKVFLEEELGFVNKAAGKGESSVLYEKYSDQESMFKVRTSKDGLLFVSDTYYPGWKAYVDDVETKIYKANFAFRAIAVPAGEHVVKMTYKPDSFFNGLRLSAISLTFLLLGGVTKVLIGRKHGKAYT